MLLLLRYCWHWRCRLFEALPLVYLQRHQVHRGQEDLLLLQLLLLLLLPLVHRQPQHQQHQEACPLSALPLHPYPEAYHHLAH